MNQQSTLAIAYAMKDSPGVERVGHYTDENGNPVEVRIDFTNDMLIIAADEYDDDGNVEGFTYTRYDSQAQHDAGEETETDGSRDTADFVDIITKTALTSKDTETVARPLD